ncbi:Calmodulin [Paragonimus heterotremus]|uniref:Calmodulin n=1 Tax=Paragonimus heterotremus TaxID=100268 RepID=A0A8J4TRC4_9TREM|nr:Calmodulin [Paragonimus heterotremus]
MPMSNTTRDGLMMLFKMLDTDGNNSISLKELTCELAKFGFRKKQIETFLSTFDLNGDNEITLDEYKLKLEIPFEGSENENPENSLNPHAEKLMNLFAELDKDKNGKITKEELNEGLRKQNFEKEQIEELMQELDLDGDGTITLGEYKVALGLTYESLTEWRRLFDQLDTDRSGDISLPELKACFDNAGMTILTSGITAWIAEHDRNKDGKLDYQEFLSFVGQQAERSVP